MATMFRLLVLSIVITVNTKGEAAGDFHDLSNRYWEWRLQDSPEFGNSIGITKYRENIESFSVAILEQRNDKITDFRNELKDIDRTMLNQTTQIAYDVLMDVFETYLAGYKWRNYGPMNPVTFLEGIWRYPDYHVPVTMETFEHFDNFVDQIVLLGLQVDDLISRMNVAIKHQTTSHNVTVLRAMPQIDDLIADSPTGVVLYKIFVEKLGNSSLSEGDKTILRDRVYSATTVFRKQYRKLRDYINEVYLPNTRVHYGVNSLPDGENYYRACLKWHLSIDITPEEIHEDGLKEIEKISGEMRKVLDNLNFKGTVKEFFEFLKNDSKFLIQSPTETLDRYRSLINDRIKPKLDKYFMDIPESKLEVKKMPYPGPGGSYSFGTPDGERPGVFRVNVFRPEENPTYEMAALTLHEASPGHHLQDIYSKSAKGFPVFMRAKLLTNYFTIPLRFPLYTAYTEGWALYAESLGEKDELDIYKDDYELMGRYSSEIFRACRLVVDTGLHHYNWTRERAINFVLNYTSITRQGVETEIDRYITWPGQATAYKIGELVIEKLRNYATSTLGDKFDIRKFHSVILNSGAVPLEILERRVNEWVEQEKDTLEKISSDFWTWRLENSPEFASTLNNYKYNDKLNSYKYEKFDTDRIAVSRFSFRLSNINRKTLTEDKKVSFDILKNMLDVFLAGYKWKDYQSLNPINFLEGWFVGFDLFVSVTSFNTQGDFVNYIRRIILAPNQLDEMMNLSRIAIEKGHVSNNASVWRIPAQIDSMVNGTAEESKLYAPFKKTGSELFVSNRYRDILNDTLINAISDFLGKLKEVKKFLQEEYMPNTRTGFGIGTMEHGKENYQACLYFHTSVNITPEKVHQTGLEEVARIERQIRDKMERVGFPRNSNIQMMYQNLTSNTSFLIQDSDETLAKFRSIIFNRIAPKIPQYLSHPPDLPLEVRGSSSDGIGGFYMVGTVDGSRPGIFYANVLRPKYNPTYKMVALSLHEAIPGHHLAESYGILADAPEFRKHFEWLSYGVPYFFPFYNAYAEGWALYAEFLGEEMGIYQDDYEMLGRYSEEMLRAVRLVVDTGIHYYNWTRERSINYMLNYTAETSESAAIEIDRYATWPGQACGYKIGEIKIKELRKKASDKLGDLFNLADFHYAVLKHGAMPLDVLERIVDDWIDKVLSENRPTSHCNNNNASSADIPSKSSFNVPLTVTMILIVNLVLY